MAGPLSNILMALIALFIGFKNEFLIDFYYKNLALFLINILPIVPLDGGMVMKKILNYRLGYDGGNKAMKVISFLFLLVLMTLFAVFLYLQKFNPSLCIFAVFLIGNVIFSKEKYDTNLLKELLYAREKRSKKSTSYAKVLETDYKTPKIEIAKKFKPCEKCFVFLTDNSKIKEIISKEQIVEYLLRDI